MYTNSIIFRRAIYVYMLKRIENRKLNDNMFSCGYCKILGFGINSIYLLKELAKYNPKIGLYWDKPGQWVNRTRWLNNAIEDCDWSMNIIQQLISRIIYLYLKICFSKRSYV